MTADPLVLVQILEEERPQEIVAVHRQPRIRSLGDVVPARMMRRMPEGDSKMVVTRFAPSPTGFLHIGGARTALFNQLLARHHGGEYRLRIEDTDKARSTQAAVDAIIDGLEWLGLAPDGDIVFQSQRADRHMEVAQAMLDAGTAFRCYVTSEELAARRETGEQLRAAGDPKADEYLKPFRSPYRDGHSPADASQPFTVRLRAPGSGSIEINDEVKGSVSIAAEEIDDLILLRADGTPTYMLAVVVDDHDMGVTHVVRGDDHFRNTFRQRPIFEANGWDVPVFAHVPLIHGQDGAKLSKRHGALGIEAYRDMGYLPQGLRNYLLRLGWSHGDQEFFSDEEAQKLFTLSGLNASPARIDFDKMGAVNAHWLRQYDPALISDLVISQIERDRPLTAEDRDRITLAAPYLLDRGQTIVDLATACAFLLQGRPVELNKGARKALRGDGLENLSEAKSVLENADEWKAASLKSALEQRAEAKGVGFGKLGAPLRAALTGGLPSPDIGLVMEWFGKPEVLARIEDQIVAATSDN